MKSIVRLCAAAAFASLLAPSALADEGLYLRLGGGVSAMDEDVFANADFDPGYMATAAVGYNWFFPDAVADVRVEIEGSYRRNDVNSISDNAATGDAQMFGVMANGYFDFRTTWPVVPYLGFGMGAARILYEDDGAGAIFLPVDDNDTKFAYQVMGGFNYDLGSNLAVGVEYRYFEAERFELRDSGLNSFDPEYKHHSVLATITLGF